MQKLTYPTEVTSAICDWSNAAVASQVFFVFELALVCQNGQPSQIEVCDNVCVTAELSNYACDDALGFCRNAVCSEHKMDLLDPLPRNELLTETPLFEHWKFCQWSWINRNIN